MVTCVTLDPLALRPRLSPGLPLSNEKNGGGLLWKKRKAWEFPRLARWPRTRAWNIFGGLAILVTSVTLDPLALRPRLSPGLPLSEFFCLLSEHAARNP